MTVIELNLSTYLTHQQINWYTWGQRSLYPVAMCEIAEFRREDQDKLSNWPEQAYGPVDDAAQAGERLDTIAVILGHDLNLHHSKLNMKPTKVGSVVEWHQDLAYLPHTNDDLMTVMIYLDDATSANGCVQVIPRRHTQFFDHHTEDGYFAGMITEDVESGRFGQPVSCEGPAGSVIMMHCMTPHSSHPNRSDKPRRTLIFEYRAANSFPIQWMYNEKILPELYRPIRGQRARFARFGGPAPYIPVLKDSYTSIYDLQSQTKAKLDEQATGAWWRWRNKAAYSPFSKANPYLDFTSLLFPFQLPFGCVSGE